jgi:hypothetical protein
MKHLTFISFLLISRFCYAQSDKIDSLISKLDNNQLRGTCHYAWVVELNSEAGWELIKTGKSATDKLIPALADSSKGIVVHYILTNIYKPDSNWIQTISWADRDNLLVYLCNELYFFESSNGTYADKNSLILNTYRWRSYIKKAVTK